MGGKLGGRIGRFVLAGWVVLTTAGCPSDPSVMPDEDGGDAVDAGPSDGGPLPDAGGAVDAACDCDDGVACTQDSCSTDGCAHRVRHLDCAAGSYCDASAGCVGGETCATSADCARPDACVTPTCDAASRTCVYAVLDGDGDGEPPGVCGGADCDDGDPDVRPGAAEQCDGLDSDCSGGLDGPTAAGCRTDQTCDGSACACGPGMTDCDFGFGWAECRNLQTDPTSCGTCDTYCVEGQTCTLGTCACAPGLTDCTLDWGLCADTGTDPQHCGACGMGCGGLDCIMGACGCTAPEVACIDASGFSSCSVLSTNPAHCGACENSCLYGATCTSARCSADVDAFFRAYGRRVDGFRSAGNAAFARDDVTGAFVVRHSAASSVSGVLRPRGELPDVPMALWASNDVVAQLDPSGGWTREVTASARATTVAAGGGRHALHFFTNLASVTVAGRAQARSGSGYWNAVFVLDAVSGAPLFSAALPGPEVASVGVAPDGGVVVGLARATSSLDLGSGVSVPASTTEPGIVVWLAADGTPRRATRVHGRPERIAFDPSGGAVVIVNVYDATPTTFSFGGATFSTSGDYAVHYDAASGAHVRSFDVSGIGPFVPLENALVAVFYDFSSETTIRRFEHEGTGARLGAASAPGAFSNATVSGVVRMGSDLLIGGELGFGTDARVGGIALAWGSSSYVARLDPTTLTADAAGAVDAGVSVDAPTIAASATRAYVGGVLAGPGGSPRLGEDQLPTGRYDGFFVAEIGFAP